MITLEQHLAAHFLHRIPGGPPTALCSCGWETRYVRTVEEGVELHAAHVAATWREARTVRTVEDVSALQDDTQIMFLDADGDLASFTLHRIADGIPEGFDERCLALWLDTMTAVIVWTPEDGVL